VTGSAVAVGTNINQTFSPTVHNHYAESGQNVTPFSDKTASRPSILEIVEDLGKERKPYEASQIHKHYIGILVSWPVVFYALHEYPHHSGWTVRLASPENTLYGVSIGIDLERYPKLRVLDRGHKAWVDGKIRAIDSATFYLEDGARITLE